MKAAKKVQLDLFQTSGDIAEVQISYKQKIKPSERRKVSSSQDVYEILTQCYDENQMGYREFFVILLLNRANKVLGWVKISEGGISGTVADTKMIFAIALQTGASAVILSHNHPSGNLKPSESDIKTTDTLKKAGKMLDLPILDHVIITEDGYTSLADEGLM